jgi:hypothetical protein
LLARGRTPPAVAAELGVSRQAVWQWTRNPHFAAELRRLHDLLARSGGEEVTVAQSRQPIGYRQRDGRST